MADIVMVDPVGTGFSRALGDTPGADYWGIDEDARSLAQFVRRFLSEHDRWNSPRYLLGESYGTTRSAVLARHLQRANVDVNGIVLVSSVLQFNTIRFAPGDDLPYIVNLPSWATTATANTCPAAACATGTGPGRAGAARSCAAEAPPTWRQTWPRR